MLPFKDVDYKYCHVRQSCSSDRSDVCLPLLEPLGPVPTMMLTLTSLKFAGQEVWGSSPITQVPTEDLHIEMEFSAPLDPTTVFAESTFALKGPEATGTPVPLSISHPAKTRVSLLVTETLIDQRQYWLEVSDQLKGATGENFEALSVAVTTLAEPLAVMSRDDLLTTVQKETFKYFWDFAHPDSGMSRERDSSGDLVTSGGSGFGLMCIIVGIERGFITRKEGIERLDKILTFLETADRFHGAWPHWLDGKTGKVIPFSKRDDGADLVETAYLVQGLLTFRKYLNSDDHEEKELIERIKTLWQDVEWDWFTQDGQEVLYWHWSPNKGWAINLPIQGYNEALITYILAASSPTHSIHENVYHVGWARNGDLKNGKKFYGRTLPLGDDYGGPLFFAHYSFLGMDPRNLKDKYADYWEQNVNHVAINRAYCLDNPKGYTSYGEDLWGLTACDVMDGYTACSPTNDIGVIAPTAALSSFPYSPDESMKVLKHLYNDPGHKMWKHYGFYDSCNPTRDWVSRTYLAIDQGPIVIMIENYRSALLWNLFMSCSDVQDGLKKLNFTY